MTGSIDRVRAWMRRHVTAVAGGAAVLLGLSGALAIATVPDSNRVVHGCVITIAGSNFTPAPGQNFRIIDPEPPASQTCDPAAREAPISFSQEGPVGPTGPAGVPGGPGATGVSDANVCRTPVGHLVLAGSLSVSADLCAVRLVRVGPAGLVARESPVSAYSEFAVTKQLDKSSPKLLKAATQGTVFKSAKIQVYVPGTTSVAKAYQLNNALISSYGTDLGLVKPTETLTLISAPKKGV